MNVKKINYYYLNKRRRNQLVVVVLLLAIYPLVVFGWSPAMSGRISVIKADRAYRAGHFDDAEVFYRTAQSSEKNSAELEYDLGNSYYKQERYAEAIRVYRKARSADENLNACIFSNLGNACYMVGDLLSSADAYKKALVLNSKDPEVKRNLLLVLTKIYAVPPMQVNDSDKNKTNKKSENKGTSKGSQEPGEKKEEKLSDSNIAGILSQISRNEQSAKGAINKSRSKNKPPAVTGQDY